MLKNKYILIVLSIFVILFATNVFAAVDIENIAIIAAISLDKDGDNYEVCAQIAVSDNSNNSSKPLQQSTTLSGKGATPDAALDDITQKTGWKPDLTFCALILFGESVYENNDIVTCMDFITRDKHFCDNAILVCTDGAAKEYLNSSTLLDEVFAFSLVKIFAKDGFQNINSNVVMAKQFIKNKFAKVDNMLSYIQKKSAEDEGTSGGTEQTAEKKEEKEKPSDFLVTQSVIFCGDKYAGKLSDTQTQALHLLIKKVSKGHVTLKNIQAKNYFIDNVEVILNSCPAKICVNFDENRYRVICDINLKIEVDISHLESMDMPTAINLDHNIAPEIKTTLQKQLEFQIKDLLNALAKSNSDVLGLENRMFKYHPAIYKKYFEHGEFWLDNTEYKINIKVI